ncbi:MAG: aldehyde ferredoxin oxidoreductase [Spirochaetae bacterium HGW-Spirochaetae-1]|jgi:aldehyde:ferredoxin oxidoreductase|nr:MAG: aldehyde ferredoxin oxidoreductase [Spirochaetae bacterium HGW-Spirochaetae-1]
MQEITGTSNKILEVDLTMQTFTVADISDKDRRMYLGGKGIGLKLLYDRLQPGIDPLGEDNIFILAMGVFMGTGVPCSGRFEAITKSPLTGTMVTASCGGPFGMALKTSGWDAMVIRGKARNPVYLAVDSKGVRFKPAGSIWGKNTEKAEEHLLKEGSGAMVIGQAGENLVRYANIRSGHRFLGRGGMGAVLGSKNLKGIVAAGKEFKMAPVNVKKFEKLNRQFLKYINQNAITAGSFRSYGTNANLNLSNAAGILPVRNFTGGTHGSAYKISGEAMAENFNTKFDTCKPCSILCGHKGTIEGEERHIPEYETITLLGSNLEIFDPVLISRWNELCSEYGMDTISTGGTLAWAMEATEKGLIKTGLKFGNPDGVSEMIKDIALRRGIGRDLALGSALASKKYGGEDFAMHVKGMELPGYDPRGCFGQGLSYATANRGGCHLSSYVLSLEAFLGMADPHALRWKPFMVKFLENTFAAVNSLHICQFTAFAVFLEPPLIKATPTFLIKILNQNISLLALNLMDVSLWPELWHAILGKRYIPYLSMLKFSKAGERVHVLERYMNTREGISRKDDTLPRRLLTEGRKCDAGEKTVPLEPMLKKYYRLRGYDANGIPKKRTLRRLGITVQ